jgi:hypothetical protein
MKIPLTLAIAMGIIISAAAQEPPAPPRRSVINSANVETERQNLGANYAISLKGELYKGEPINLTLRGLGPDFNTVLVEPRVAVGISVERTGETFLLSYLISMTVARKNGDRTEFEQSSVKGSITIAEGGSETIITNGEGSLTLGIDKVPDEKK